MKTLSFGRQSCSLVVANAVLTIGLTFLSFQHIEPKNCYRSCGESLEGRPCQSGGCPIGEQKAGWPLPAIVDAPGGGSPTPGWGLIGPEDPPLFVPLLLDVLFYSLMLWLVMAIFQLIRKRTLPVKNLVLSLPLSTFLTVVLWMSFWSFGSPIHRLHYGQVYIDTPAGRSANMAFLPEVLIPVEELVENYGNPSNVWVMSEGSPEKPLTRIILHWNSIAMFAELPEVRAETYTIKKTTGVKRIIFPYEEQVFAFDGKPLGKQFPWTGYGIYQP